MLSYVELCWVNLKPNFEFNKADKMSDIHLFAWMAQG